MRRDFVVARVGLYDYKCWFILMSRFPFLTSSLFLACLLLFTASARVASCQELVFEDKFEGRLTPGWEWLRGNAPCRRFANNSLEILSEPFVAGEARNALTRPLSFLRWQNGKAVYSYRIETECCFLEDCASLDQQCGVCWIQDDKIIFKLVFARADGRTFVYPGKVPIKTPGGRLRLTVDGRNVVAEFACLDETVFRRVYEGRLNSAPNDRISLQCWEERDDDAQDQTRCGRWVRFRYFRVEKIDY